jgi:hypothetical protein
MEDSVAGSVAVVAGRRILTRRPVAVAGVVAALRTRTPLVGGRPQRGPGVPQRLPTQKGAEHHSIRVLKLPIPTRRTAGEHQVGALGHRIHTPLPLQTRGAQGQAGAVLRLLGEVPRPNRRRPLGMTVRPRRVIMAGLARGQQVREDGAANRAG